MNIPTQTETLTDANPSDNVTDETSDHRSVILTGIARLRASRAASTATPAAIAGRKWAMDHASYDQLVNLAAWEPQRAVERPAVKLLRAYEVATVAFPGRDLSASTKQLFIDEAGLTSEEINDNGFVLGFANGAIGVLPEVDSDVQSTK